MDYLVLENEIWILKGTQRLFQGFLNLCGSEHLLVNWSNCEE